MAGGMFERLEQLRERHEELTRQASDPEIIAQPGRSRVVLRELGSLAKIVRAYRDYQGVVKELEDARGLARVETDKELRAMAEEETGRLETRRHAMLDQLVQMVADEEEGLSGRNVIMEIRAGEGGDEAALFARDLYDMYRRYCERQGWKTETLDFSPTELGGLREVTFAVNGADAWRKLRFESGGHRVQRVPETEQQGRIHTSACTVAVLPEAEETEVELRPEDLEMQACRAGGPGGQNVNKTSSAVRLTHKPSGIVVRCQEESSQYKNRIRAEKILRAKLFEMIFEKRKRERDQSRKSQIGSGGRHERIRTYNFPQNRVTDHRINFEVKDLENVIKGDLDAIVTALLEADRKRFLEGENGRSG